MSIQLKEYEVHGNFRSIKEFSDEDQIDPEEFKDEFAPLQSLEIGVSGRDEQDEPHRVKRLNFARSLLYVSHFFAQFSEGAWQFALILFLAAVCDYQSLLLVSTYGMTSFAAVCLWGARVGRFVDGANRLFAAQRFIWTENVGVVVASGLCYVLLTHTKALPPKPGPEASWWEQYIYGVPTDTLSLILLVGIHIFGPLAQIFDHGFLVAIERDWIVVMSRSHPKAKEWLSTTNVALKQIDLLCRIVAPAVAGFVVGAYGKNGGNSSNHSDLTGAALLVGILNALSLVVEYICTAKIYHLIPDLSVKTAQQVESAENIENPDGDTGDTIPNDSEDWSRCKICSFPHGISIYLKQPIAWGGIGLAMLYVNALTFGGLMTAFLVWKGMSTETAGLWRGISSAMGLLGTFVFHASVKRLTIVQTGKWSIIYLFGCLSLCFASFFVEDYTISMTMLIFGACFSRIGLWVFDISITQLMQEFIPDGIRGVVGGTQEAINSFFQLFSFSLGLVFPNPRQFYIFAAAGYISIGIAMILYITGVASKADAFRMPNEK